MNSLDQEIFSHPVNTRSIIDTETPVFEFIEQIIPSVMLPLCLKILKKKQTLASHESEEVVCFMKSKIMTALMI